MNGRAPHSLEDENILNSGMIQLKRALVVLAVLVFGEVGAQSTLTLQPGASAGCDATLGFHTNYNKDLNYGDQPHIKLFCIPGASGGNNTCRALISFDLSKVPAGATITSAKLTLYASGKINDKLPGHFGNNTATISRVTSPWTEFGVKWNTMPSHTPKDMATLHRSTDPNQDYTCDVTMMIKEMISTPGSNYGFYCALVKENPASPAALTFCSSDHPDSGKHPKLVIVYSIPDSKLPGALAGDSVHQEKTTAQEQVGSASVEKPEMKVSQDSTAGTLVIKTGELSNAVIRIFASDGKFVKSIEFKGVFSTFSIPIGDLSPGTYSIEIISDTEKGQLKFVKRE